MTLIESFFSLAFFASSIILMLIARKSSKSEKQEGEVKNRAVRILIRQVVRRKMEKKYRQLLN